MLTWSPNRMDSTNQKRLPPDARADCDVFHTRLPWKVMVKLYKFSFFFHHGDIICHPASGYVTTKLHGTSTCGCNNNVIRQRYFHNACRRRMPATLIWPQQSIGGSCQSGNMTALLNSLLFAFRMSFLPKYRVKYYAYIVKWCSGV